MARRCVWWCIPRPATWPWTGRRGGALPRPHRSHRYRKISPATLSACASIIFTTFRPTFHPSVFHRALTFGFPLAQLCSFLLREGDYRYVRDVECFGPRLLEIGLRSEERRV